MAIKQKNRDIEEAEMRAFMKDVHRRSKRVCRKLSGQIDEEDRSAFVQDVAAESGMSVASVKKVYDALVSVSKNNKQVGLIMTHDFGVSEVGIDIVYDSIIETIRNSVSSGQILSLLDFGTFYLQRHKGHPAHFGGKQLDDYIVFKFSSSDVLNKDLREKDAKGKITTPNDLASKK